MTERENVRIEIGTHCSWEELHLSQVLVTIQMICRYYWNLGVENRKGSNEAPEKHSTRTLADKKQTLIDTFQPHPLTLRWACCWKMDRDGEIEQAIWLQFRLNSFRCDMSIRINRHLWTAGRGRGGLEGRERWEGQRETVSEVAPPCKSKSSMLLTCTPQ